MRREELVDLNAFATVAEERSFTRAAAKLGTSQSALIDPPPLMAGSIALEYVA